MPTLLLRALAEIIGQHHLHLMFHLPLMYMSIHMSPEETVMPEIQLPTREAKLFRNNKSQAVRIPVDFEFPGDRVLLKKDGDRLVIEPIQPPSLLDVLARLKPLGTDDVFPNIDDTLLPAGDVEL